MYINFQRAILFCLAIFVLGNTGCTPEDPEVPGCTDPTSLNYNPNATIDDGSCQYNTGPSANTDTISNNITSATTLTNLTGGVDYFICGSITVSADLTIEPGVSIVMCANAALTIAANGSINAVGTATEPITISGETNSSGYWRLLRVVSDNPNNVMHHVQISDGGGDAFYSDAMIWLENNSASAQMEFQNCTIANSLGYGVFVENGCELPNFQNNTFADNGNAGLRIPVDQMDALDVASTYNQNNAEDYVEANASTVDANMTVLGIPVPFLMTGNTSFEADVVFSAGVSVLMDAGARITVAANGSFTCDGTAADIVDIRGAVATPGHWGLIRIVSNNPANSFTYTSIQHGGNDAFYSNATVWLEDNSTASTLSLQNVTIANSSGYGLFVERGANIGSTFANNLFTDNGTYGLRIPATNMGRLDSGSDYSGNSEGFIEVEGRVVGSNMSVAPTNVPYLLTGNTDFEGDISLDPGVDIAMAAGARISVSDGGSLNAVGTATDRITIEGEVAAAGFWDLILINSNNPLNDFQYVDISHGGNSSFYSNATIWLENNSVSSSLNFENSSVNDSFGYGIYVENGTSLTGNLATNSYSNNGNGSGFSCSGGNCDVFFQ